MAGVMDVLFQSPPPEYISQVNIPGMSEAGAMVQGRRFLPTSETLVEMMCKGAMAADFAPVLTVNKEKRVLAIKTNLWFDRKNNHSEGVGEAKFVK